MSEKPQKGSILNRWLKEDERQFKTEELSEEEKSEIEELIKQLYGEGEQKKEMALKDIKPIYEARDTLKQVADKLANKRGFTTFDEWEEQKHPRGEGGQFVSKGSGSAGSKSKQASTQLDLPKNSYKVTAPNGEYIGIIHETAGGKTLIERKNPPVGMSEIEELPNNVTPAEYLKRLQKNGAVIEKAGEENKKPNILKMRQTTLKENMKKAGVSYFDLKEGSDTRRASKIKKAMGKGWEIGERRGFGGTVATDFVKRTEGNKTAKLYPQKNGKFYIVMYKNGEEISDDFSSSISDIYDTAEDFFGGDDE